MSNDSYFIREYRRNNLIEDIMKFFPKLKQPINIPRSDGTISKGSILLSNFTINRYAMFYIKEQKWVIQTFCYNKDNSLTYKFITINELALSNFSELEIKNINKSLDKGVKKFIDYTNVSPDFHSMNSNQFNFDINVELDPNFNPDIFLNLPIIKI